MDLVILAALGNAEGSFALNMVLIVVLLSSVQLMVTKQAIFTIMHCAADEHMEVSIHVTTARH